MPSHVRTIGSRLYGRHDDDARREAVAGDARHVLDQLVARPPVEFAALCARLGWRATRLLDAIEAVRQRGVRIVTADRLAVRIVEADRRRAADLLNARPAPPT